MQRVARAMRSRCYRDWHVLPAAAASSSSRVHNRWRGGGGGGGVIGPRRYNTGRGTTHRRRTLAVRVARRRHIVAVPCACYAGRPRRPVDVLLWTLPLPFGLGGGGKLAGIARSKLLLPPRSNVAKTTVVFLRNKSRDQQSTARVVLSWSRGFTFLDQFSSIYNPLFVVFCVYSIIFRTLPLVFGWTGGGLWVSLWYAKAARYYSYFSCPLYFYHWNILFLQSVVGDVLRITILFNPDIW